jgi:hypothetical protein
MQNTQESRPHGINFIDLTGQRYGRLAVISFANSNGRTVRWHCKCDCGAERIVSTTSLRSGTSQSCGCYARERTSETSFVHGMSNTKIYRLWRSMHERCYDPKNNSYRYYGAKGITVCERWHQFENFYADMGERPADMSLDRIKSTKEYSKENCRWATLKDQARNRRSSRFLTFKGETKTVAEWAEIIGVHQNCLYGRLNRERMSVEDALSKPFRKITKRVS